MAQDIVADALNQIKNASNAKQKTLAIRHYSKFLLSLFEIMRRRKYIESYRLNPEQRTVEVTLGKIQECKAVKPRLTVSKEEIEKYVERYLPARDYGTLILSTNEGLVTHEEAIEKNIGGSLIAFFY